MVSLKTSSQLTGQPGRTSRLVFFVALSLSTQGFLVLFQPTTLDPEQGNPSIQKLWLIVYAATTLVGIAVLIRRRSEIPTAPLGLVVIAALAFGSFAWSVDPSVTLRRATALLLTFSVGYILSFSVRVDAALRILRISLIVLAVSSLVIRFIDPASAYDRLLPDGGFRGVFYQKNNLARIMVIAIATEILSARMHITKIRVSVAILLLEGALLFLSQSATAIIVTVLLAPLILIITTTAHRNIPKMLLGYLIAAVGALFLYSVAPSILNRLLNLLGKDLTLTNRTYIWSTVLQYVRTRPLLGWGYGAFWNSGSASPQPQIQQYFGYPVVQGHNGFLDVTADLGLAGLVLVSIVFLIAIVRSLYQRVRFGTPEGAVAATFLLTLLLYNIDEGPLLAQNQLITVLFAYACCLLTAGRLAAVEKPLPQESRVRG